MLVEKQRESLKYRRVFRIRVNYNLFLCIQSCVFKKGSTYINKHCLLEPNMCNAILHAERIIYTERTFSNSKFLLQLQLFISVEVIDLFFLINSKYISVYLYYLFSFLNVCVCIYMYTHTHTHTSKCAVYKQEYEKCSFRIMSDFALRVQQCYFVHKSDNNSTFKTLILFILFAVNIQRKKRKN